MSGLAPFESSIAEHYHEETKYSEQGLLASSARFPPLDWSDRPEPFKSYPGESLLLPAAGLPIDRRGAEAADFPPTAIDGGVDGETIAQLLWYTNGCTRLIPHVGGFQHYRAAPSAGAMYPTEVYVATRDVPGLEDGIYDYHVLEHALARVRPGDVFERLESAAFGHPAVGASQVVFLFTAEWYRSSWRYRERGYRRALLDTGHVLGNLIETAPTLGFRAFGLVSFHDGMIEELLGVDPVREGILAVAPLVAASTARGVPRIAERASRTTEWHAAMNALGDRVSPEIPEGPIAALHLAGRLASDATPASGMTPARAQPPQGAIAIPAGIGPTAWSGDDRIVDTIARRRSTRRFAPPPVERLPLFRALSHAMEDRADHLAAAALLNTFVVSMNVVGVPPGTYLYEPDELNLFELSRGQTASAMLHLGLDQDIFVHAAAAIVHTVDLTRAVQTYGDRAYRLVHLDAGHIGERLNLALLHEGIGVSGCAGFYDDQMNRVLQIPESQAVIYITTLGTPA